MKIRTTLLFMMGLISLPFYWFFKDCLKKLDDKVPPGGCLCHSPKTRDRRKEDLS